jgi:hypothetical protein
MSLPIKDGNGDGAVLKTTPDAGEHVSHHIVDSSALPSGASTAAHQVTQNTALSAIQTATVATQAAAELANTSGQTFTQVIMDTEATTPVATNGAAAALTAAPTAGKKIVIDRIEFYETDAGTPGTNDGLCAAGDLIVVQFQQETSGTVLLRRTLKVVATGDLQNRWFAVDCARPIKLPTADKKVFIRIFVNDSGSSAVVRNLTGYINIWYHSET